VLVTDDDPVSLQVAVDDLEGEFVVHVAESGAAALALLERESFELLLLDLNMPHMDGFHVLERLRRNGATELPVIVLSGDDQSDVSARALQQGAADFVAKPWLQDELLARVRTHIALRRREHELEDMLERLNERTQALEQEMATRKRMQTQLMLAERMSSLGAVAAGVAHEINNPLTYLIGNLGLIRRRLAQAANTGATPDWTALNRCLDLASEGAERVAGIVRDLKTFSRPDSELIEPVDLREVIESVLRITGHELTTRARLELKLDNLPYVRGNSPRLGQVVLNVVTNATHALEGSPAQNATLFISATELRDGRVELMLRDTGPGFNAEALERAFDPFFTTKGDSVGTGLGLSICRDIMEGFGGSIEIGNAPEGGAYVRLFLQSARQPAHGPSTRPPSVFPTTRIRLLIVDDEPIVRQALGAMLEDNHDIVLAESGQAALALFRSGQVFDMVLCDLMMSPITGMELHFVATTEGLCGKAQWLFMTGGATTETARNFAEHHRDVMLEKPLSPRVLLEAIQARLEEAEPL
jgi:signal transduction histidine kinase